MFNKKYFVQGIGRMLDFSGSYNNSLFYQYFKYSGSDRDAYAFAQDEMKLKLDMFTSMARLEKLYGSKRK